MFDIFIKTIQMKYISIKINYFRSLALWLSVVLEPD